MKKLLVGLLVLGSFSTFAATMSENASIPRGYAEGNANSLINATALFNEFGSAVVCGESDSHLNLYIKATVGSKRFKIVSISSTDIQDIGKATCAAILKL